MMRLGVISKDDYEQLIVDSQRITICNHLLWTLDEFSYINSSASDIELLARTVEIENRNKRLVPRGLRKTKTEKLSVEIFLSSMNFCKFALSDITKAFELIKFPPLSDKQLAAGFGNLSFGENGIARMVGEFENIGTVEAFKLPMHFILSSIHQNAQIMMCRHREQELIRAEMESKKRYKG